MILVADTSGLLCALDRSHPRSKAARATLDGAGAVVVSPLVLTELDHVGRRVLGRVATSEAIDTILRWSRAGRVVLPQVPPGLLEAAQQVRGHYEDLDLDLADAVNVALAADFVTDTLLTLDQRDFRAVRPLTSHAAFRLLPDDSTS